MKKNKIAESLIAIVIGIFIISFVIMGLISILTYNNDITNFYDEEINKYMIEANTETIIKKIDNSSISDNETFYLNKNTLTKNYDIKTGSINEQYKYIDKLGNNIDPNLNVGKTYTREFTKNIDILRHTLYPNELPNLIFHFDAMNIDGTFNSTLNDGDYISRLTDLSGHDFHGVQSNSSKRTTFDKDIIDGNPGVKFDGIDDTYQIDNNYMINNDDICATENVYMEKSFALVLKTGYDVNSQQIIYEQGGQATGYNFMVYNGDIYAGIHNKAIVPGYSCFTDTSQVRDSGHKFKSVNLGEVLPDTVYFLMIVQDSTHKGETGNQTIDDANNKLQIFKNGILIMESNHVDPQPEHYKIGIGATNAWNIRPWSPYKTIENGDGEGGCDDECLFFEGSVGELISWNYALTKDEVIGVQNYFVQKWLRGNESIFYNLVDTKIKKFNN